jgi:hypothetical protein
MARDAFENIIEGKTHAACTQMHDAHGAGEHNQQNTNNQCSHSPLNGK